MALVIDAVFFLSTTSRALTTQYYYPSVQDYLRITDVIDHLVEYIPAFFSPRAVVIPVKHKHQMREGPNESNLL